jgi:hypothetical protein
MTDGPKICDLPKTVELTSRRNTQIFMKQRQHNIKPLLGKNRVWLGEMAARSHVLKKYARIHVEML